jgi:hypothetical protein
MKFPIKGSDSIVVSARVRLLTYKKIRAANINISKLISDYMEKVADKLDKDLEGK